MEDLLQILEDLHDDIDYTSCTTLIDDRILDSYDIVTIIAEIDDVFDVTIPADQIIPENFNSASSLYALVEKLLDD